MTPWRDMTEKQKQGIRDSVRRSQKRATMWRHHWQQVAMYKDYLRKRNVPGY